MENVKTVYPPQTKFAGGIIIVFLGNVEPFLYRDVSTFLEKTFIQSWPKIWLHPYIEKIPHFLRKQLFSLDQKSGHISR